MSIGTPLGPEVNVELGNNTKVTTSLGVIIAVVGFLWISFQAVQAATDRIKKNEEDIVEIRVVLQNMSLQQFNSEISDRHSEERSLRRLERTDPANNLIKQQLEQVEDEIEELEIARCLAFPDLKGCR